MNFYPTLGEALFRNAIGYDPLPRFLETATDNFPPHNIEKIDENHYRLTLAVAGFSKEEVEVSVHDGFLTVTGAKAAEPEGDYLYRGIGLRSFTRKFKIGEHVEVVSARSTNGLLEIDLERQIPDEKKPRLISIE